MKLAEIEDIINKLRQQIPNLQMQLNQAEGYRQALIDLEQSDSSNKDLEKKDKK